MGYADPHTVDGKKVHPMFFYRIPANPESINTGGLYRDPMLNNTFWVVLTNGCDLDLKDVKIKNTNPPQFQKERKADHILLAACVPLTAFSEYETWIGKPDEKSIRSLIGNNRAGEQPERWFFLPSGVEFPDMLIDFQHLRTVSAEELAAMTVFANIDSPFVESLISKFIRFYARVGTPDLDAEMVLSRIKRPPAPDPKLSAARPAPK